MIEFVMDLQFRSKNLHSIQACIVIHRDVVMNYGHEESTLFLKRI